MKPADRAFLEMLAKSLRSAEPHEDGGSILKASDFRLQIWAEELERMTAKRRGGRASKASMHLHWAVCYWSARLRSPDDIAGALLRVQVLTRQLWPRESVPSEPTILRVARKHRDEALGQLEADLFFGKPHVNVAPLRARLAKRSPRPAMRRRRRGEN